jgi:hypothetical protein
MPDADAGDPSRARHANAHTAVQPLTGQLRGNIEVIDGRWGVARRCLGSFLRSPVRGRSGWTRIRLVL